MSIRTKTLIVSASVLMVLCLTIGANAQGADLRADIELRREWVARLQETERRFYNMLSSAPPPYILFYSNNIRTGNVNYQTETAEVSVSLLLAVDREWFSELEQSLQEARRVEVGLHNTGRKDEWGLNEWPMRGLTETNPFYISSYSPRLWQYQIVADLELVDARGQVLGRQRTGFRPYFTISRNTIGYLSRVEDSLRTRLGYYIPERTIERGGERRTIMGEREMEHGYIETNVSFGNMKVDDINENLTVRLATVHVATVRDTITSRSTTDGSITITSVINWLPPQTSRFRTRSMEEQERIEAEQRAEQERREAEEARVREEQQRLERERLERETREREEQRRAEEQRLAEQRQRAIAEQLERERPMLSRIVGGTWRSYQGSINLRISVNFESDGAYAVVDIISANSVAGSARMRVSYVQETGTYSFTFLEWRTRPTNNRYRNIVLENVTLSGNGNSLRVRFNGTNFNLTRRARL